MSVDYPITVEGVDSPLARELTVFSSKINPLIGRWREERASGGVRELLFQSDGLYAATWLLLESWMDLFGTYNVDTSTGKIEFIEDWKRVETPGFRGQGYFRIDEDGTLLLSGICATEPDPDNPTASADSCARISAIAQFPAPGSLPLRFR